LVEEVMMIRWSLVAVLVLGSVAMAEEPAGEQQDEAEDVTPRIYRTLDEKGRPVFTDTPDSRQPSEEVEVREQNTIKMVQPRQLIQAPEQQGEEALTYKLAITSPADQTTVHNPESMTVRMSAQPELQEGHRLRLLDNGEESATTIAYPDRGEHRFVAQVVDADGEVLAESDPVVVYVHRVTVKN
jgi:hypothetical protein